MVYQEVSRCFLVFLGDSGRECVSGSFRGVSGCVRESRGSFKMYLEVLLCLNGVSVLLSLRTMVTESD